ncbi:telomere end binding protein [Rutstroemia sp. NJR-2017a WRK4]|nr:telomere end binding protein [Rutstroemia sp. NJR-2017a WRK4]
MAATEQDGSVKSTLESLTHIPIAELTPDLEAPGSRAVKAVVTLTWPYSSATGAVAFLLAEPDFRLRRNKGQVRVQFSGSSAKVIAKSGIASGDEVILSLDGVDWITDASVALNATPGRGVDFELKFTEKLLLQRARTSYGSLFDSDYDPFEQEDGSVRGKGRKRTRLSTTWRLTSRSPSPSPELEEPTLISAEMSTVETRMNEEPAMMDEGVQTMEVDNTLDNSELAQPEQTPSKMDTVEIQEIRSTERVHNEPSVQSPLPQTTERQDISPVGALENTISLPNISTEAPRIVLDNALSDTFPTSPELRPQPSEGLPLVSPLVTKQIEMFRHDGSDSLNATGDTTSLEDSHGQPFTGREDDLYNATPPQPNSTSETTSFQDSTATYGDGSFFQHVDPLIASSGQDQFVVEENAQQPSEHNFVAVASSPVPAHDEVYDAGKTGDKGDLNYPDPNQINPDSSSNWKAQPSAAYPDPEDRHSHSTGHSPYPLLPRMDRSASAQSQTVDLTEDDEHGDEDAEGYSDESIEDDGNNYVPNARYRVEKTDEAGQDDEDFDEVEDEDGGYDEEEQYVSEKARPKYPADYEEEYSDDYEYDENDEKDVEKSYDNHPEEKDYGSGEDFDDEDEESYSEEDMDDEDTRPQHQPQGEPEIIDLLSSDEEDADDGASEPVPPPARHVHQTEPRPESDAERSELDSREEDESDRHDEEGDGEHEENDSQYEESDGEEGNAESAPAPKSEHAVRESSIDSIEHRSLHEDDDELPGASAIATEEMGVDEDADGDRDADADQEEEEEEDGFSEPHLQPAADLQPQSDASTTAHIRDKSPATEQQPAEQDKSIAYESMDIDETTVSPPNPDDNPAREQDTDNLDGLLEKLESSETEAQHEPKDNVSDSMELDKDEDNIEKLSAPRVDLTDDEENLAPTSEPAETSEALVEDESHTSAKLGEMSEIHNEVQDESSAPTEQSIRYPVLDDQSLPDELASKEELLVRDNKKAFENDDSSSGELSNKVEGPDKPVLQDASAVATPAEAGTKTSTKVDQASRSGWSRNPRKQGSLFSSVFGVDGASEDDENATEETNEDTTTTYPILPADDVDTESSSEKPEDVPHPQSGADVDRSVRRGSNGQLPTPDDTQKVTFSQVSDLSVSDQLQSQLQEELGEDDEDMESWHDSRVTQIEVEEKIYDSEADDDNSEIYEEAVQEVEQTVIEPESILLNEAPAISTDIDFTVDNLEDIEVTLESSEVVAKSESMVLNVAPATDAVVEDSTNGATENETQELQQEDPHTDLAVPHDAEAADNDELDSDIEAIATDVEVTKTEIIEVQSSEVVHTETELANDETPALHRDDAEQGKIEGVQIETVVLRETDMDLENESDNDHVSAQAKPHIHVKEELITETTTIVDEDQSEDVESRVDTNEVTQEEPPSTSKSSKGSQRATKAAKKSRKGNVITSPRKTRSQKTQPLMPAPTTPVKSNKENKALPKVSATRSSRSPSPILDEEETPHGHDVSAQLAIESLESPVKAGHHLRGALDPKVRLNRYFRTELSEFTTLNGLRPKKNSRVDVLAIVTSIPPEPQKAKSGPKHYLTTFTVIDQSTFPNTVVEVVVYRPYKDALPTPVVGDGVLLRDFTVIAAKGKGFSLKSEEGSSWAVFKEEGTEVEVRGPPVEFGHAEKKHVKDLREWFHGLDEGSREQIQKVTAVMEAKSAAKGQSPEKTKK